jgi:hypothetical protein
MLLLLLLQVLQKVVAERQLEVWVHPVPPVLNETRHIVMPFNELMRQRVCNISGCSAPHACISMHHSMHGPLFWPHAAHGC